jgi:hypothetical protein
MHGSLAENAPEPASSNESAAFQPEKCERREMTDEALSIAQFSQTGKRNAAASSITLAARNIPFSRRPALATCV